MANVTINAGSVLLDVENLSSNKIVTAHLVLAPSGSGQVSANRIIGNYDRALELADLVEKGYIQVKLGNVVLTPAQLLGFDAVTAVKPVFADANRPAASEFSDGEAIYNTDDNTDNVAEGGVWYGTDGLPT